jgi:hypothetical protein
MATAVFDRLQSPNEVCYSEQGSRESAALSLAAWQKREAAVSTLSDSAPFSRTIGTIGNRGSGEHRRVTDRMSPCLPAPGYRFRSAREAATGRPPRGFSPSPPGRRASLTTGSRRCLSVTSCKRSWRYTKRAGCTTPLIEVSLSASGKRADPGVSASPCTALRRRQRGTAHAVRTSAGRQTRRGRMYRARYRPRTGPSR